jgi:hypothetical protein
MVHVQPSFPPLGPDAASAAAHSDEQTCRRWPSRWSIRLSTGLLGVACVFLLLSLLRIGWTIAMP